MGRRVLSRLVDKVQCMYSYVHPYSTAILQLPKARAFCSNHRISPTVAGTYILGPFVLLLSS
jgi:hypothetical protein